MERSGTSIVMQRQIDQFLKETGFNPSAVQRKAIQSILDNSEVLMLSGYGTGKTAVFRFCEEFLKTKGRQARYERSIEGQV